MADRLISADALIEYANCEITSPFAYPQGQKTEDEKAYREKWEFVRNVVMCAPTVEAEPTLSELAQYCEKRNLVLVESALFNEMKSRWSAEPRKQGHWIGCSDGTCLCSRCLKTNEPTNYCPNCGARMDEREWEEPEINPCRGCGDYDGRGGCISNGGCGAKMDLSEVEE